jgi:alanine racemase
VSVEGQARPSWVDVDLDALRHNARELAKRVHPAVLCAVVKANAYGHGAVETATALLEGGAQGLAVALVDEGIELRQGGIIAPILLLSEPTPETMTAVFAAVLTPTLTTIEGVRAAADAAKQIGSRNPVHVKVDTGMHRMGVAPEQLGALLEEIAKHDQLILEGLWTHLSVADERADESIRFTAQQLERFDEAVAHAAQRDMEPPVLHVANSAGALVNPGARYSMVRCGLVLYGLSPSGFASEMAELEAPLELKPAMSIRSTVIAVRDLEQGARPSYGRKRAMPRAGRVVTVPLGYADGFPRALFSLGQEVLIGGRRHPLAGMVTMDQLVVDVGDAPVEVGDEVVLLGRQGDETITVAEWAERLGTIPWEVVCGIGDRVPRRYVGAKLAALPSPKRRWWRPS